MATTHRSEAGDWHCAHAVGDPEPTAVDKEEEKILDSYPVGNYVVITGGITSGYKFWGPVPTMREAVKFCEDRDPLLGHCTIVNVEPFDACPIRVCGD